MAFIKNSFTIDGKVVPKGTTCTIVGVSNSEIIKKSYPQSDNGLEDYYLMIKLSDVYECLVDRSLVQE